MAVLFEILVEERPDEAALAIPHLSPLLDNDTGYIRGEAANILGIIGSPEALAILKEHANDPDPQVREIIADFLDRP